MRGLWRLKESIGSGSKRISRSARGTRLYDGKDYFTIYDFVKAYHHFSDPELDGEPVAPEPRPEPRPGPAATPDEPPSPREPRPRPRKIQVKLSDGKERTIQHMMMTSFWHPGGQPMSAHQFMELLFGKLPEFFKNEAELRATPKPAPGFSRAWPKKVLANSSYPRCSASLTPKRVTFSMSWATSLTPFLPSPENSAPPAPALPPPPS